MFKKLVLLTHLTPPKDAGSLTSNELTPTGTNNSSRNHWRSAFSFYPAVHTRCRGHRYYAVRVLYPTTPRRKFSQLLPALPCIPVISPQVLHPQFPVPTLTISMTDERFQIRIPQRFASSHFTPEPQRKYDTHDKANSGSS